MGLQRSTEDWELSEGTRNRYCARPRAPCCGGRMIIIETFERGCNTAGGLRGPPPRDHRSGPRAIAGTRPSSGLELAPRTFGGGNDDEVLHRLIRLFTSGACCGRRLTVRQCGVTAEVEVDEDRAKIGDSPRC